MKSDRKSSSSDSRHVPGRVRVWAFRLIALTLVPLLVLVAMEVVLRVAGYGYSTEFFQEQRIGDRDFLVENPSFSLRFFPPHLARWPTPIRMAPEKPAGTVRIFVLGESAAQGDPEPAFGAGRYLEALLKERFPDQRFEVVNVSITAINSNVILPIARECARQHGDLWIVYMGNNEVVGPFGAATIFGAKAPPLWAIRLSLAIEQTRVGQLLQALTRHLKGRNAEPSWGGMQMFLGNQIGSDDPRRQVVCRNFDRNLRDILRTGLDSGAKVLLNTVAVNLRDSAPFASLGNTNLAASDQARFQRCVADADVAAQQGEFGRAAELLGAAAQIDPDMAETQFKLGEALLQRGDGDRAAARFQRACDTDALPFRADSRINDILRRAGREMGDSNLVFLDAATVLGSEAPLRIPGAETFYEHVHFNFDGNYRLALVWAGAVAEMMPQSLTRPLSAHWASQATCEQRLGLTDWNRLLVVKSVLERLNAPPLSQRSNASRQREVLLAELGRLGSQTTPDAATNARALYDVALQRNPEDHFLHENYAGFLQSIGDLAGSAGQWEQARTLQPQDPVAWFQCGHVLELAGQWAAAQSNLVEAVSLRPTLVEGWFELGKVQFSEGRYEDALRAFETARGLRPNDARIWCESGRALSLLKRTDEALRQFERAVALDPASVDVRYAFGSQLALLNQVAQAREQFQEVVRLKPDFAPAHLNLGVAMMMQGQPADAAREFETALRLRPDDQTAATYLRKAQAQAAGR